MSTDIAMKVDADHLRRDAFLYVRQSSLRQVFENTESTKCASRRHGLMKCHRRQSQISVASFHEVARRSPYEDTGHVTRVVFDKQATV